MQLEKNYIGRVQKRHYCDTEALPEWGAGPDGRPVNIAGDERIPGLFAEWQADECQHEAALIVCEPDSLGRDQYYKRCSHCGLRLSSAVAHAEAQRIGIAVDLTQELIEARARVYVADRRSRLEKIKRDAAERCQSGNRQSYDDYLRSPEWRRRAAKIMERAKGVCEGCLTNKANEVHHLTYEHIGAEFAFELVALCSPCHRRFHAR